MGICSSSLAMNMETEEGKETYKGSKKTESD